MYDLIISHINEILANTASPISKQKLLDELFEKLKSEDHLDGRDITSPYSVVLPDGEHTKEIDFLIKGTISEETPLNPDDLVNHDPFESIEAVFDVICENGCDENSLVNECLDSLSKVFNFVRSSNYHVQSAGVICILRSLDKAKYLELEIEKHNEYSFTYKDIHEDVGDFCIFAVVGY